MEAGSGQVDDLAGLATLDEKSLLEEIRARYQRNVIYTYIGDILVAVNPYRPLHIYAKEYGRKYTDVKVRSAAPPHVFYVSDACYQSMRRTGASQCCVVSGESGAGKTETTKLLVQHIAHLCKHDSSDLHERIVQVNPLLEAFGNAQTAMNNNSSRFGKFIELKFDHQGKILGAKLSEYLLEKSRVVSQGRAERNFHIFYYMFSGLTQEQLQNNLLYRPEAHRILRSPDGAPVFLSEADYMYNQEMWDKLTHIMNVVGFMPEELNGFLAMLAAILHLTDIEFEEDRDLDGGVFVRNEELLDMAATLLAAPPEELAAALISNVHSLRGERIVTLKTLYQACDGRDALAKALYGRLFAWIVRQINYMLQPDSKRSAPGPTIGILDIAGFENFEKNSFEQLCINTANEQLQYYFNQHIFQWELDEYRREGVKGKDVKFVDNRPIVDLFLESPLGVLSLVDEESRFPQGSDASLVDKLAKNFGKRAAFSRARGGNQDVFTIHHYAGPVMYNVVGFLEKNRDTLSWNLLDCMKNSESQFVSDLFFAPISDTGSMLKNLDAGPKRSRKSLLLCKAPDLSMYSKGKSMSKAAGKRLKEKARQAKTTDRIYENAVRTLSSSFKMSLTDLMAKLLEAEPHFVRCLKPNTEKVPHVFVPELVKEQLRYTGVLETVKIRRQGYATRMLHRTFIERFRYIAFPFTGKVEICAASIKTILNKAELKDWEIGKTKVFLKYWHMEQLNLHLDRVSWRIIDAQRIVRGFLTRRRLRALHQRIHAERQLIQSFCSTVAMAADNTGYSLGRAVDHDAQRFNNKLQEREDNVRRAQAQLRPPSGGSEPNQAPLPSAAPEQQAAPQRRPLKKGVFLPTPIILGNPVYGNPDPVTTNPNLTSNHTNHTVRTNSQNYESGPSLYTSNQGNSPVTAPKPGIRRGNLTTPNMADSIHSSSSLSSRHLPSASYRGHASGTSLRNEYPTDTLASSRSGDYEHTSNSTAHLARGGGRTPVQGGMSPINHKPGQLFMKQQLDEALEKFPDLDQEIWAKVFYIEKNQVVAKVQLREWEVIIDDSRMEFDGKVVGVRAFDNPYRDANVNAAIKKIGKGIKLSRDSTGNIFATRLSDSDIICKGYKAPENSCFSAEIVENLGRLQKRNPMKIFCMNEYKSHIALELQAASINQDRLQALTATSLAFNRNTFDDLDTPAWIMIINFCALDILGNERVLEEVKSLAHLNLGSLDGPEDAQLRRNWVRLQQHRGQRRDDRSRDDRMEHIEQVLSEQVPPPATQKRGSQGSEPRSPSSPSYDLSIPYSSAVNQTGSTSNSNNNNGLSPAYGSNLRTEKKVWAKAQVQGRDTMYS